MDLTENDEQPRCKGWVADQVVLIGRDQAHTSAHGDTGKESAVDPEGMAIRGPWHGCKVQEAKAERQVPDKSLAESGMSSPDNITCRDSSGNVSHSVSREDSSPAVHLEQANVSMSLHQLLHQPPDCFITDMGHGILSSHDKAKTTIEATVHTRVKTKIPPSATLCFSDVCHSEPKLLTVRLAMKNAIEHLTSPRTRMRKILPQR